MKRKTRIGQPLPRTRLPSDPKSLEWQQHPSDGRPRNTIRPRTKNVAMIRNPCPASCQTPKKDTLLHARVGILPPGCIDLREGLHLGTARHTLEATTVLLDSTPTKAVHSSIRLGAHKTGYYRPLRHLLRHTKRQTRVP